MREREKERNIKHAVLLLGYMGKKKKRERERLNKSKMISENSG